MQPSLVSIMMPAFNAEQYIEQAIASVLSQTYPHWELVVVNDGSTDGTAQVAAQFKDPRIKLVHQANGGESAARNTALKQMQGEVVAFLDADDLYLPQHLERAVRYLEEHPQYDGVYTDGYYCDEAGRPMQPLSSQRRGPFEGRIFEEMVRASDVFGPPLCVVVRRDLILQQELRFDPLIVIGPDWDFWIRACDVALFGYGDWATCLYRVHQTNITTRVAAQKRALSLARCREKAIQMESFTACSAATRVAVFYDLLVNLLAGFPERQTALTEGSQFRRLPAHEQARLLRLMASKAVARGGTHGYISDWFHHARRLNPADRRGRLLHRLYDANPALCQWLLTVKSRAVPETKLVSPFGRLL